MKLLRATRGLTALVLGACAAAQHPQEAPREPCDVAHGVVVAAAEALDAHLVCDASVSVLPFARYLEDGLGPSTATAAPLSEAARAQWVSAFAGDTPEPDAWRCRGNVCVAPAPDASVLRELDPDATVTEGTNAFWVLVLDGPCVFDVRLIVSTTPGADPLAPPTPDTTGATQRLRAHVCPGADVFIDGRFVGLSPLVLPVSIGEHRIRIRYRLGPREVWEQEWRRRVPADAPDGFGRQLHHAAPICPCSASSRSE